MSYFIKDTLKETSEVILIDDRVIKTFTLPNEWIVGPCFVITMKFKIITTVTASLCQHNNKFNDNNKCKLCSRFYLLHNLYLLQLKSQTLVKQEDVWVTDSDNTFATSKEMTRTHPDQSLDLSNHFKKLMVVYGLSLHLGSSESQNSIRKIYLSNRHT